MTRYWTSTIVRSHRFTSQISDMAQLAMAHRLKMTINQGLASIVNAITMKIDWAQANSGDRQLIQGVKAVLGKTLLEGTQSERAKPQDILKALSELKIHAGSIRDGKSTRAELVNADDVEFAVGSYQVSEMLGDNWELWKSLFVPTLPARSQILQHDITSVITGPRGCGKTMLFRRLSERLIVECGPVSESGQNTFVGIYINANDISDAFSVFPDHPDPASIANLYCFTHLCLLSDILAVESTRMRLRDSRPSAELIDLLDRWIGRAHRLELSPNLRHEIRHTKFFEGEFEACLHRVAHLLASSKWRQLSACNQGCPLAV